MFPLSFASFYFHLFTFYWIYNGKCGMQHTAIHVFLRAFEGEAPNMVGGEVVVVRHGRVRERELDE